MTEKFKLEIISPVQSLLNIEVKQVIIPAYEGYMTILKDHISLITFLRPGFIETEIENKTERFYVEEGTVEFFNDKLLILTASTINLENLALRLKLYLFPYHQQFLCTGYPLISNLYLE